MDEAQWALFVVLDGTKRHDLYDAFGLNEEEVDRVWAAYEKACVLYHNQTQTIVRAATIKGGN